MADTPPLPSLPPPPKQPVRTAHRALGLLGALFLALLVATGIGLQHPTALGLDQAYIANRWVLNWYGIDAPSARVIDTGQHRVGNIGELLTLDGNPLTTTSTELLGAVSTPNGVVLLLPNELLIVSEAGELIERIPTPAPAIAIGRADSQLVLRTEAGDYVADDELLSLEARAESNAIDVVVAQLAIEDEADALADAYLDRVLTVERLLLDLHSGRIFGRYGVWLIDLGALLVLVLAMTGLMLARRR